jgi:hypothetical protein
MKINFERLMKKLSITKKRISAIFFAIILLLTTAMIPTMKVSAAPTASIEDATYEDEKAGIEAAVAEINALGSVTIEVTMDVANEGADAAPIAPPTSSQVNSVVPFTDAKEPAGFTLKTSGSVITFTVPPADYDKILDDDGPFTTTATIVTIDGVNVSALDLTASFSYSNVDTYYDAHNGGGNEIPGMTEFSWGDDARSYKNTITFTFGDVALPYKVTVPSGTTTTKEYAYPGETVTLTSDLVLGHNETVMWVFAPYKDVPIENHLGVLNNDLHTFMFSMPAKDVTINMALVDQWYDITVTNCETSGTTAFEDEPITFTAPEKDASGNLFDGWLITKTDDPTFIILDMSGVSGGGITNANPYEYSARPFDVTVTAKYVAPKSSSPNSGSSSNMEYPTIPQVSLPAPSVNTPVTLQPSEPPAATSAADVKVDETPAEDGKVTVTVGDKAIETSSTSAATAIAAGTASEVITSGNAVAVVTTDGAVIAGANASGSLNSASTIAALNAAAASAEIGDEVKISAGADVSVISAATINKLLAAAEESGVDAVIAAAATDETGAAIAEIAIPLTGETRTSIKTGLILADESIDKAVAEREKASGVTILASLKTEQKTSFGTKVTFSFATETLGIEAEEGDTYYVAILRGDGKTVQVKAEIIDGELVFTTASAGVIMISNEKFTK